jgi:integrase/recombinase XerC
MSAIDKKEVGDPIEYFLEDQEYLDNSYSTIQGYRRVLYDFSDFIEDPNRNTKDRELRPGEVDKRVCMAWVQTLRNDDIGYSDSSIAYYAQQLHGFYQYMSESGIFEANPMRPVLDKMPEETNSSPTRREISVPEMAAFIGQIHNPLVKAYVMTFVKTGIRHGELQNIDIRDIHIDDPDIKDEYPEVRTIIDNRPNSLYIPSDISEGDIVNGDKRSKSNKRERDTVIPIDDELQLVLGRYLAARPDSDNPADPLFVRGGEAWGKRLTDSYLNRFLRYETVPYGWYDADGDRSANVTPHYFRHFFTTHLRNLGDKNMVSFIRGDTGGDIMDTYTHNWNGRVREQYEASIYKLL